MSKNWIKERKHDHFYRKAKTEGYRSRASYKLLQMNDRFSVMVRGDIVVELGSAPGGWTQVAVRIVGWEGLVVAVDLDRMEPVEGAFFIKGDMTDEATLGIVLEKLKEARKDQELKAVRMARPGFAGTGPDGAEFLRADAVISDMSPNISGNYSLDQARSVDLSYKALVSATRLLKPGGRFLVKVFEGEDFEWFMEKVRSAFEFVKVHSPKASRSQSSEVYVFARGFDPETRLEFDLGSVDDEDYSQFYK